MTNILDFDKDDKDIPKGYKRVATPKNEVPYIPKTYKVGDKTENKQTSIYLDLDVIAEINRLSSLNNKAKSHYVNELLATVFGLQKRSNGIILEDKENE